MSTAEITLESIFAKHHEEPRRFAIVAELSPLPEP